MKTPMRRYEERTVRSNMTACVNHVHKYDYLADMRECETEVRVEILNDPKRVFVNRQMWEAMCEAIYARTTQVRGAALGDLLPIAFAATEKKAREDEREKMKPELDRVYHFGRFKAFTEAERWAHSSQTIAWPVWISAQIIDAKIMSSGGDHGTNETEIAPMRGDSYAGDRTGHTELLGRHETLSCEVVGLKRREDLLQKRVADLEAHRTELFEKVNKINAWRRAP